MDCRSEGPIIKRCRREDFIPNCHEEMQEWMQGRQADLQTAVGAGQLQEVARISKLLTTAAQGVAGVDQPVCHNAVASCERSEVSPSRVGDAWNGLRHGCCKVRLVVKILSRRRLRSRHEVHPIVNVHFGAREFMGRIVTKWGFRGVRVGEASHPGPSVAARRGQDSTSDDEPLVRPNVGRDVVPRRHRDDVDVASPGCMETLLDGLEEYLAVRNSDVSATVPATPGALAVAGAVSEVVPGPEEGISVVNEHNGAQVSQFDLTQRDCDTDSSSETVSCGEDHVVPQSRRLRLVWDQARVEMHDDEGRVDHPTVRAAQHLIHTVVRRIGVVHVGAPLPRALQHQSGPH